MEKLLDILNSAIEKYSTRDFYDEILKAKEEYFELTGKIEADDVDYESRMNGFNFWYLTQRNSDEGNTLLQTYLEENSIDEKIKESLLNITHSLFEYKGLSFSKKHSFKDILQDIKITVAKDSFHLQLIKDDLFIARTVELDGQVNILNDISVLPHEVRSILVKESKRVRKLKDGKRDFQFLIRVEKLKTKWRRYGHLDPKKIFNMSI